MRDTMYKFVLIEGSCGNPYDIGKAEQNANNMDKRGYDLVQVYQTSTSGCTGSKSALVMIFEQREGINKLS